MITRVPSVLLVTESERAPLPFTDLVRSGRLRAVGRADAGAAARATEERRPDVVVVDVSSVAGLGGLGRIADAMPEPKVVVVCGVPTEVALLPALVAGARGFVCKPAEEAELAAAVDAVARGGCHVDPRAMGALVELALRAHPARTDDGLTARQSQVLGLVQAGLTQREIADMLGVSTETVRSHLYAAVRRSEGEA